MSQFAKKFILFVTFLVVLVVMVSFLFKELKGIYFDANANHRRVVFSEVGGLEMGSQVFMRGVKIGKVGKVELLKDEGGDLPQVHVTLWIDKKYHDYLHEDASAYIRWSGVLGEKFVELKEGTLSKPVLTAVHQIKGAPPTDLDAVFSRGGDIIQTLSIWFDENQDTLKNFLNQGQSLMKDTNRLIKSREKEELLTLMQNLNKLSSNLNSLTDPLLTQDSKVLFNKLSGLIQRAYDVDKDSLKKFFQEEGIRTKVF